MSTTTRNRGDRYRPIECAQQSVLDEEHYMTLNIHRETVDPGKYKTNL